MLDIRNYFKSTIALVKSLTIKIDVNSKHFNYQFFIKNKLPIPTAYEDKYFLNLAGVRSTIDPQVFIHDNTTGSDIEVTIENLNTNLWLKDELNKFGTLFDKLCTTYPGMSTYIRGCINPIDLDTVIATKTNTVLYYDKRYIAENELYIIPEIEGYVNTYMAAYHNPNYMLDELYVPTLIFNLYQSIVMFVIAKRFSNVLTHKTDNFHINNHLSSYKRIYDVIDVFSKSTELYLYGNMNRLKTNLGKNKTLDELLYMVYDKNRYGVGNLVFNKRVPEKIDGYEYMYDKEFFKNGYDFTVRKANDSLYTLNGKEYNLIEIFTLEDTSGLVRDDSMMDSAFSINEKNESLFLKDINNDTNTKMFLLDKPERIVTRDNNVFIAMVSNTINTFMNTDVVLYIDYINPNDHKLYKLSNTDIVNILLYNILLLYKLDADDVTIELSGIFNKDVDKDITLEKTWHKRDNSKVFDYILGSDPITFNSASDLNNYFSLINELEKRMWYMISNVIDLSIKNDIRIISKDIITYKKVNVNKSDTLNYLKERGLLSFITGSPIYNITKLTQSITGIELSPSDAVIERFKKVVEFFNKTTSYTIQLVYDTVFKDVFVNATTKTNLNLGYKSFIEIKDAEWYKYEQVDYLIKSMSIGSDYIDSVVLPEIDTLGFIPMKLTNCTAMTESVETISTITANKIVYPVPYRTRAPEAHHIEDGDIDMYRTDTNMASVGLVREIKTEFIDDGRISSENDNVILTASPLTYLRNYITRGLTYTTLIDNDSLMVNDTGLDLVPKPSGPYSVYTDKEDVTELNYSYHRDTYNRNMQTGSTTLKDNIKDEEINIDLTAIPIERNYESTVVETNVEDVEVSLTFEITNK